MTDKRRNRQNLPNRVFEWPPPAPTPSPTPGGPYFLDRVDPCEDLYPEASTPRPSYLVNTVTRSLTKYDGTTESWDIPEIEDAMAEVLAQDYAAFYSVIKAADPSARVFCCGNYTTFPSQWWWSFLYHLKHNHPDVHLDGVHLHTYLPSDSGSFRFLPSARTPGIKKMPPHHR